MLLADLISVDLLLQALDVAVQILVPVLVAVGVALLSRLYQWATERVGAERAAELRQVALEAVVMAEQLYRHYQPGQKYAREKFERAARAIREYAQRHGYMITYADIERLIESAVGAYNEATGKLAKPPAEK